MSERAALLLAAGAATGALAALRVPLVAVAVAVLAAMVTWRPLAFVVAATLACSMLAARADAGLRPPRPGSVAAWATLLSDPREAAGGAMQVDVEVEGRRLRAWARGGAAAALRHRLAGEQVFIQGSSGALAPSTARRLRWRHIAGRVSVEEVRANRRGLPHTVVANAIRRTLATGAADLGVADRALLAGFVLGDDRSQPPWLADDFRAAGLTHLLAVSGQNVAFVLVLVSPLLGRAPPRVRLLGAGLVLALFGTITRWEPSVVRAVAMAAVAMAGASAGRPATSSRTLALAVTGLLLVDPLLVHSVGFVLSVGACLGIATLSGPLARRLPGPHWLRLPLAVTLAAQAGVSPILVPVFGGVPVASLPANLLAAPAAGPVMVWGLAGGLAAGVLGSPAAAVIHLPTRALLGWVRWVAATSAGAPLGEIRGSHAALLAAVAGLVWWRPRMLRVGVGLSVAVLLSPAVGLMRPADEAGTTVADGAQLWRRGNATVLALDGAPHAPSLLEGLRRRGVKRLDLVIVSGRSSLSSLDVLRSRHEVRMVAAPTTAQLSDAAQLEDGDRVRVGRLVLVVTAVSPRLALAADPDSDGGGAAQ